MEEKFSNTIVTDDYIEIQFLASRPQYRLEEITALTEHCEGKRPQFECLNQILNKGISKEDANAFIVAYLYFLSKHPHQCPVNALQIIANSLHKDLYYDEAEQGIGKFERLFDNIDKDFETPYRE